MIEAITDLSWKAYPAIALMTIGVGLMFIGIRRLAIALGLANRNPDEMMNFMTGFRIAVLGVTLLGLGVAWNWGLLWVFVLALVFGGEEVMESSTHLYIIRRGKKTKLSSSVRLPEDMSTGAPA